MAGRPKTPLALVKQRGTYKNHGGRLKAREQEFKLTPGNIGPAPDWYSPEALEEWDRLTQDEEYKGVLAPSHRGTMIHYCFLWGKVTRAYQGKLAWEYEQALERAKAEGNRRLLTELEKRRVFETTNEKEGSLLNSLRSQMGLSPTLTGKIQVAGRKKEKDPAQEAWASLASFRPGHKEVVS